MKIKLVAKDDQMVAVPGTAQFAGQVARFINREWDEKLHAFPAVAEPFECDADSDDGRRLLKIARRDGALLPFDQATADVIGVPFVALKFNAGVWVTAPASTKKGDA